MLFISDQYLVFFSIVFIAYWLTPWATSRVWLLLIASIVFYATWNVLLAAMICASTTGDYLIARGMAASSAPRLRFALCVLSVTLNLGLLAYFKYANWFLSSLEQTLTAAGHMAAFPVLQVILPIGISFYTFEAISYTIEVYRGRLQAERSLPRLLLFILFFPHLIAGPIVRPRHFLPQIRRPKRWRWNRAQLGVELILAGIIKKVVIADQMARFADPVFAAPAEFGSGAIWLATIAYALQIYGDFSGYSDIAIGSAHLLGYKLPRNFNAPYLATSVAEFWHRWHISLSTWLRDYLYIPLGGNRGTSWQTARNIMTTMTLGGLWHGASWTFLGWGIVHGLLLLTHRCYRQTAAPARAWLWRAVPTPLLTLTGLALTFLAVAITWVLFRAVDFPTAATMLQRLVVPTAGRAPPLDATTFWLIVGLVVVCHVAAYWDGWRRLRVGVPAPLLGAGYAAALCVALVLAPGASKPFIYFQF